MSQQTFNSFLRDLLRKPPEIRAAWEKKLRESNPEGYKQVTQYFKANPGAFDEALGYEHWLRKLGPATFTRPFAPIQHRFWQWNWSIVQKLIDNIPLEPREFVAFLPWSRETGKCLRKGTEILKADGTRIPIEQVVEGDILVSIDQATGQSVPDRVKEVLYTGTKPCFRLKTRTGKFLDLTAEHRLWTFNGWREVQQIQKGDRVALPRRSLVKPTALHSDEELRLLAYMIAEGGTTSVVRSYKTKTSHSLFTNADKVIVDDFKYCAESMGFGVRPSGRYGYRMREANQSSRRVSTCQNWIREMGLAHKGAHEKRVPDWVFQSPERQRWMFLAAMIDTDGWTTKSEGLAIALTSEGLIDDLEYLFLSVGVVTVKRYRKSKNPNHRDVWVLSVDKEYLSRCGTYMPLRLKGRKLIDAVLYSQRSLLDAYPSSIGKGLPRGVNRKIRDLGGPQLNSQYPLLTRPKIRAALALCAVPQLAWLEQAQVFWDEVVSIAPIGNHEVYDIEMTSRSHNFIANGIVSHNSSCVEWACIVEGALLRTGYIIYLSAKQLQAEEHVVAIRNRIESEHVDKVYPWLSKPKMGQHGNKFGWSKDFLMTSGGWAIRPVGADQAIRGGKTLNLRPTLIVVDDLDELGDSPYIVEHKENLLTRSVLPMGNEKTRVLVPQNPIHQNSVVNRMLTGASMALAIRTVFGEIEEDNTMTQRPIAAVKDFAYEVRQTDDGPVSVITQGRSLWPGIDLAGWERTLNRVGPPAFIAEYQHDLSIAQEERVLPEYDDRVLRLHVITWSQFLARYGHTRIPSDWPCAVGLDLGYSSLHRSAWSFLAKAPEGQPLSGSVFLYRARTFTGTSIDDQAVAIRSQLWPGEFLERQVMSHEKLGERLLLANKHDWFFQPCDSAKTAGIPQWRHFLQTDRSQPHPFHRDERDPNGLWKLGRPAFFNIVADDQLIAPRDDLGQKNHRDSAYNWRMRPIKLNESGLTVEQPMKADDDETDSVRMVFSGTASFAEKLMTQAQRTAAMIPQGYHRQELMKREDLHPSQAAMTADVAEWLARRSMAEKKPKPRDYYGQVVAG